MATKKAAPAKKAPAKKAAPKPAAKKVPLKKKVSRIAKAVATTATAAAIAAVSLTRPVWNTSLPNWQERIVSGQTLTPCPPLFPEAAKEGMEVFNALQMVSAGITFGDVRPWVSEFAEAIYGGYCGIKGHECEGRQLIKTFFMLISKKNGKSETAGAIMLTALILNWRQDAEFIILSPTKEVADNSFKPMMSAIKADPELDEKFHVQAFTRTITHRITNATLKVVAADTGTVVGKKAAGVLVDELHEFGKNAKAEDMLTEATGGLMSRPEGFVIYLTTQSSEPPAGVFKKELDYARMVRDGKDREGNPFSDPSYYPIIYEFPDEYLNPVTKPYLDPKNWHMVNPNYGLSVDEETLRQKMRKAGQSGEDSLQAVISKHLNIQVGLDLAADRWPGAEFWLATAHKLEQPDTTTLTGVMEAIMRPQGKRKVDPAWLLSHCEVLTCGVDGGGLDDLLALTVTGRLKRVDGQPDKFMSWSHCWAHPSVLARRMEIAPRLKDFEAAGELTVVTKIGEDAEQLATIVKTLYDTGMVAHLGIDPSKIAALTEAMEAKGLPTKDPKWFVKVSQGWHLYSAMLWVERGLGAGTYLHADQDIMNWAVGNAKCEARANSMLVTKKLSGSAKIDPVMSSFCAAEVMAYNPESRSGGYSDDAFTLMG
jgi:phage terminase large subunit-like protein